MTLSFAFAEGMTAALKKYAVSGGMYARALQGAAQRGGGRIAPQVLAQVGAQPRAAASSFLSQQARAPGALTPTLGQREVQTMMNRVPFAGGDNGGNLAQARQALNTELGNSGRSFAAPDINHQIGASFGYRGRGISIGASIPNNPMDAASTVVGVRRRATPLATANTVSMRAPL